MSTFENDRELLVAFSTRKNEEDAKPIVERFQKMIGWKNTAYIVNNPNGASLTSVYNHVFDKFPTFRHVLFIHDDIDILTVGWGRRLMELFDNNPEYGLIGMAGSKNYELDGGWWSFKNIFGQVEHRTNDHGNYLTSFSPYFKHDLEEVCVIDGLFMAIDREKATCRFDEGIKGFDFYDIDFSLQTFFEGKCKIGVTNAIRIAHESKGIPKPAWYSNHDLVNKKYEGKLPIINLQENGKIQQETK